MFSYLFNRSHYASISFLFGLFLLVRVEPLQFLQEDVAVGDGVVLVGHDEELEDGPPARPEEQDGPVPVRPGFCVHHNLIQLVPEQQDRSEHCIKAHSGLFSPMTAKSIVK